MTFNSWRLKPKRTFFLKQSNVITFNIPLTRRGKGVYPST